MIRTTLLAAILTVATSLATTSQTSINVEPILRGSEAADMPTQRDITGKNRVQRSQLKGWKYVEIFFGVMWGLYSPFRRFSSDFDCFSSWLFLGNAFVQESKFFDKGIDKENWFTWLEPVYSLTSIITNSVDVYFTCRAAKRESIDTRWYEVLELETTVVDEASDSKESQNQREIPASSQRQNPKPKSRKDKKWKEMDTIERLITVYLHVRINANIGFQAYEAYQLFDTEYYYFFAGYASGYSVSALFFYIDFLFKLNLVEPMAPWIRFSQGWYEDEEKGTTLDELSQFTAL